PLQRPRVLVATSVHWPATARLCLALHRVGIEVAAVAPPQHGIAKLGDRVRHFVAKPRGLATAITSAVAAWSPDFVVPCDEAALRSLHAVHRMAGTRHDPQSLRLDALIELSLGDPLSHAIAASRSAFIAFALRGGVRTAQTRLIADPAAL